MRNLEAVPVVKTRLGRMARIYCCLMVLRVIQPWVLYRMDHIVGNRGALFGTMLNNMRRRRVEGYCARVVGPLVYTCLLIPDEERATERRPYCFCTWFSMPCVAVYQPPEGRSAFLTRSLRTLLRGDPDSFICVRIPTWNRPLMWAADFLSKASNDCNTWLLRPTQPDLAPPNRKSCPRLY